MIKTKDEKVSTIIVTDILCDKCGKSCTVDCGNGMKLFEYMTLSTHWGYGSHRDGEEWTAQICEDCVEDLYTNGINFNIKGGF